jgi:hypothetical protein
MDDLNRLTKAEEGTYCGGSIISRTRQQLWTLTQTGNWDREQLDLNGDNDFVDAAEHDDSRTHNFMNEPSKYVVLERRVCRAPAKHTMKSIITSRNMFTDERLEEIASILARGVVCVLGRVSRNDSDAEFSAESGAHGLALAPSFPDRLGLMAAC